MRKICLVGVLAGVQFLASACSSVPRLWVMSVIRADRVRIDEQLPAGQVFLLVRLGSAVDFGERAESLKLAWRYGAGELPMLPRNVRAVVYGCRLEGRPQDAPGGEWSREMGPGRITLYWAVPSDQLAFTIVCVGGQRLAVKAPSAVQHLLQWH